MEFYNMKLKKKVDVPESQVRKQKLQRGTTARYQAIAELNGTKMFKFLSQAAFEGLNVPEVK